jgi:hypothetical protein
MPEGMAGACQVTWEKDEEEDEEKQTQPKDEDEDEEYDEEVDFEGDQDDYDSITIKAVGIDSSYVTRSN